MSGGRVVIGVLLAWSAGADRVDVEQVEDSSLEPGGSGADGWDVGGGGNETELAERVEEVAAGASRVAVAAPSTWGIVVVISPDFVQITTAIAHFTVAANHDGLADPDNPEENFRDYPTRLLQQAQDSSITPNRRHVRKPGLVGL